MKPEDKPLPEILAPPLAPDASFDAEVAAAFDVEWLGGRKGPAGS
jgi:hypothetical protein